MGRLKTWDIVFHDDKTVYYPGQVVNGKVFLDIRGDMRLRSLRISMKGVAKVHWTEARNTGTRLGPYTEHYDAEMEYFTKSAILFGSESVDTRFVLTEGYHEFNYQFSLPLTGLSTSFEGKYGSIRYWLKAEIDKPWSFNCKVKKAFTVITPLDINRNELLSPVENSCDTVVCCWCCSSGPVSMIARTDRMGYCPGESIAITSEFENMSGRRVIPHATLIQSQVFIAGGKQRSRQTKFTMLTGPIIHAGTVTEWDAQLLKIPAVSPSIVNCCLMRVHYTVRLTLQIRGSYSMSMDLPIVIGTVPYRPRVHHRHHHHRTTSTTGRVHHHRHGTTASRSLTGDALQLSLQGPLPLLPVLQPYEPVPPYREESSPPPPFGPPPIYAECINGTVNIDDDDDDYGGITMTAQSNGGGAGGFTMFTPMYTYVHDYQFRPPPAYSERDPHPSHSI